MSATSLHSSHSCCATQEQPWTWYKDKLLITAAAVLFVLLLGLFVPFLKPFNFAFWRYTKMIWWAIALGIFLGGLIDYYIPQAYISKYFTRRRKRTIFYSVGLGLIMSACSHGILALSMELHKKGASGSAVISFLLASPWTNLPVTLLLFGFFGLKGFVILISALLVALVTGLIFQRLEETNLIEKNAYSITVEEGFSVWSDVRRRWKVYHFTFKDFLQDLRGIAKGMWGLSEMVLWWILMGFVLASLAAAYIPSHIFQHYLGPTLLGLFITLAFAAILEVCSEGTSPLAFEIYRQTGAFGNSFVFLMAGVATDYTEIGLVWMNLGRKTALWMIAICVPQILLLGWFFNLIF
jgi:uncharacterized membrane protein YraQ (UPF0718 family)